MLFSGAGRRAEPLPFATETRVVQIPVTVTNGKGLNVGWSRGNRFSRCLTDGVPQQISPRERSRTGAAPISLVIAIQSSGISSRAMAKIRPALVAMVQPSSSRHRRRSPLLSAIFYSLIIVPNNETSRCLCQAPFLHARTVDRHIPSKAEGRALSCRRDSSPRLSLPHLCPRISISTKICLI